MTPEDIDEALEQALGHHFQKPELLAEALTHKSFHNERPRRAPRHNERLEFLGDAIVDLAASEILFERYPKAPEGELTRRRADLVCEAPLAELAKDLSVGPALRLGKGEERSGGRENSRLLASAVEALIAAIYLDSDVHQALAVAKKLLASKIQGHRPGAKDFKSRVQEKLQGQGRGTPTYALLGTKGPDHARIFRVALMLADEARTRTVRTSVGPVTLLPTDEVLAEGEGTSKLRAEQVAAERGLAALEGSSDIVVSRGAAATMIEEALDAKAKETIDP